MFAKTFAVRAASAQVQVQPAAKQEQALHVKAKRRRKPHVTMQNAAQSDVGREPIAIVGISGIFPMAKDVEAYWKILKEGKDCMTEIPKDRWDWREYEGNPAKEVNKTNVKWGGFIDGIADFDPLFFGISPREAEQMEPQQRLLLTYARRRSKMQGIRRNVCLAQNRRLHRNGKYRVQLSFVKSQLGNRRLSGGQYKPFSRSEPGQLYLESAWAERTD